MNNAPTKISYILKGWDQLNYGNYNYWTERGTSILQIAINSRYKRSNEPE